MGHKVMFLTFIFIVYSFLGWLFESLKTSIKEKRIVNRGMLNLPFVIVYGLAAVIISIAFFDTRNILLIFIGSTIYTSFLELTAGKVLEIFNKGRWWDYSKFKFNIEGYICLPMSLLWGALGTIGFLFINPLLLQLFNLINYPIIKIILLGICIVMVVDFIISYLSLTRTKETKVVDTKINKQLSKDIYERVANAYPIINKNKKTFSKDAFNIYKFLIYFFIGGVVGCLFEMVFCRFTMHRWMSRSSLIFGEISLVWGIGLALFTTFLHMYRNKSSIFLFIYGVILGTSFEYLCGAFCEYFYGYCFWDYHHLPLNVNGRIQIVFALIWGLVSVLYIKYVYTHLNKLLERINERVGKIVVTVGLILIMFDILISVTAGIRFSERRENLPPSNVVEELCDKYFTDDFMTNRFKNLKVIH